MALALSNASWCHAQEPARLPHTEVTASRLLGPLAELPASLVVLDRARVRAAPAATLDGLLGEIPGFSLFRNQSSLVSHPTTQGVSLRGIGPTGASRALVLVDGLPLNDPFGGWVYWSKVAQVSIERVEVLRGGGSSLWGNGALGGVIHVTTTSPNTNTRRLTVVGSDPWALRMEGVVSQGDADGGLLVEGRSFVSDGYYLLGSDSRGAIDRRADSQHGLFGIRYEKALSARTRLLLGTRFFREERDNGTPLTGNSTEEFMFRTGLRHEAGSGLTLSADAFVRNQKFDSTFSSQADDRSVEAPALDQFDVPSLDTGASVLLGFPSAGRVLTTAGADFTWTRGENSEDFLLGPQGFERRRKAEARRLLAGAWAQQLVALSPQWSLNGALRVDYWRSFDASREVHQRATGASLEDRDFPDRDKVVASPKLGATWQLHDSVALRGAVYRGFRAPTINELVRPFRVRSDSTAANEKLDPETLWGAELGSNWQSRNVDAGVTFFVNELSDPIFNVTVGEGPGVVEPCGFLPAGGLCRQRRNLDEARVRGAEVDLALAGPAGLQWRFGYLGTHSEITKSTQAQELRGQRLPQVPDHQLSCGFDWSVVPRFSISGRWRWIDDRFEDAENTITLGDYAVIDVRGQFELQDGWALTFGAENLLDQNYDVAKTSDGQTTLGAPLLLHVGFSFDGGED